jgi:hypothetical protein
MLTGRGYDCVTDDRKPRSGNAVLARTVASNITMRQFLPHAYGFRATAGGLLTGPQVTFPLIFEA